MTETYSTVPTVENNPVCKCPCGEQLYIGDTAYHFEGIDYCGTSCVDEHIFDTATEQDYISYCKAFKTDFYDYVDVDSILFDTSGKYPVFIYASLYSCVSKYKTFARQDKSQFGEWYRTENKMDITYRMIEEETK